AIQSDGKIVVGGPFAVSKDETFIVLARYTSEGSLDTSFDSDGLVIGPDGYFASDLALQPDGKIVLGGYTTPLNNMFLMRYE
ncbi:MAG: delta-60 repeat domain-containing protein, partial [Desulfomonilia bacterium]